MLCIGHRGAMGYAPENTIKSLTKAMELGADWVEVDVHYVDNHIIVMHDETLERTTNGKGYLADKTFSYLRSLDAGDGEKIPTLEEVLDLVWEKAGINIELKGPGTARPVIELLHKRINPGWGMENFLLSSLIHRNLYEVKKLDSRINLGLLLEGITENYLETAEELQTCSVNQDISFVNSDFVNDVHNRGMKVFVYTVNNYDDIKRMNAMGVDGVFTNYPDRVLKLAQETG
jgi:glycerophosphoryl diester phosphodiesterase